ncbi:hypothetical protein C8F01DRAFT_1262243 [Mycena amicta]|nr:hypothetical protein C8F01DRAFT_1262243 [Mycena amicta]
MASSRSSTISSYSEFFSSGLRAMSGGSPHNRSGSRSSTESPTNALKASARYNVLRGLARRSSTSAKAPSSPSSPATSISVSSPLAPAALVSKSTQPDHRRRSSLIDIPARIFGRRMSSSPPETWSLPDAPGNKQRERHQSTGSIDQDGVYLIRNYEKVDPFGSSPYSSSFFTVELEVDVEEVPAPTPTPARPRRLSLMNFHLGESPRLSLSPLQRNGTTKTHSPNQNQNQKENQKQQSRARRLSLPAAPFSRSPSSRPTLNHTRSDRYDRAWPVMRLDEHEDEDELDRDYRRRHEHEHDPVGAIDWRQFHAEIPVLLYEEV